MDIFLAILKFGGTLFAGVLGILTTLTQTHEDVQKGGRKKLNRWGRWALTLVIIGLVASLGAQIAEAFKKRAENAESRKSTEEQIAKANEMLKRLEGQAAQSSTILSNLAEQGGIARKSLDALSSESIKTGQLLTNVNIQAVQTHSVLEQLQQQTQLQEQSQKRAEQQTRIGNTSLDYVKRLLTRLNFLEVEVTYELPTNSPWATNLLYYVAPRTELAQRATTNFLESLKKSPASVEKQNGDKSPSQNVALRGIAEATDSGRTAIDPLPGYVFAVGAGTITSPFILTNDYVYQPIQTGVSNGGTASYAFNITNGGSYVVQALVNAPTDSGNSFYVNIDGMPADPYDIWQVPTTSGFQSLVVSWQGNGTYDSPQFVPEIFNLASGLHQIIIVGRGANTQLKSISILKIPGPPQSLSLIEAGSDFPARPPKPPSSIPGITLGGETGFTRQEGNPANIMGAEIVGYRNLPNGKGDTIPTVLYMVDTVDVNYGSAHIPVMIQYDDEGYFLTMDQYDISGVRHCLAGSTLQTSIQFDSLTNNFWRAAIRSGAGWRNWVQIAKAITNSEMHIAFWSENNSVSASAPDIYIGGPWSIRDAKIIYRVGATNLTLKLNYSAPRSQWSDRNSIRSIADLASATLRVSSGISAVFGLPKKNLLRQIDLQFGSSKIALTNLNPILDRGTNWIEVKLPANGEFLESGAVK